MFRCCGISPEKPSGQLWGSHDALAMSTWPVFGISGCAAAPSPVPQVPALLGCSLAAPTQLQAPSASTQGEETELRLRQKGIRSILTFSASQACLTWRGTVMGWLSCVRQNPAVTALPHRVGKNKPQVRLFAQEYPAVSLGTHGN